MTRTCWRALAGLLAVSLGTIVVCASDTKSKPAPATENTSTTVSYEPCCSMPEPPCPCPCPCPPTQCPGQVDKPSAGCPLVEVPTPAPPCLPLVPVVPVVPAVVEEVKPAPIKPVTMTAKVVEVPYRVRMEVVNGLTHVELVRGDDVALRIQCERIDLQMPSGGLHAIGKVAVIAPGMEVRCNRLMLGWSAGDIAMEGQVRMICQNGQQKTEMSAESISCRLNSIGNGLEIRNTGATDNAP